MDVIITAMQPTDWEAVRTIYQQGISTGVATLETAVPSWEVWNRSHLKKCRLVACRENRVVAWAALTPVSGRCVYEGVAEVSVYVGAAARGQGLGEGLLRQLIVESEKNGIWTLQASILPNNEASLKLHQKCGFRRVGYREKLGKLNGTWRDVVLMERRSKTVGN